MNHINIVNKSDCYGCNACVQVCPIKCIRMEPDEKGFWYPKVDENQCIQCGKCVNACQISDEGYKNPMMLESIQVYAVKHKDNNVRNSSSSGGMFTALSDYVITQGGVVFGAVYDAEFKVIHKSATTYAERDKMKGSKYVQSDVGNSFKETETLLRKGNLVLYTGTPCQIAGLYKYLGKIYDNLITCDLICHGTPSPEIFKRYLHMIESRANDKVKSVNFRHKKNNWCNLTFVIDFEKETYSNLLSCDPYGKLFLDNIILRSSCYHCQYANTSRLGDITIGDYWGIHQNMADFHDNEGVSLVFINTKKGQLMFENIKENIDVKKSRLEDCVPYNTLNGPAKLPYKSDFWKEYVKGEDFPYLLAKYAIKGIIANRFFLDKVLYHYVIIPCDKNTNERSDNIIDMLKIWKAWCDITFIEVPEKFDKIIPEYKREQQEAWSYGAFSTVAYYANKRHI